jgi:transposase
MLPAATRSAAGSDDGRHVPPLYLAFELGNRDRTLGSTTGFGQPRRERVIAGHDLSALAAELARAKRRFGLPAEAPVLSCYEAGRDGFWLRRGSPRTG